MNGKEVKCQNDWTRGSTVLNAFIVVGMLRSLQLYKLKRGAREIERMGDPFLLAHYKQLGSKERRSPYRHARTPKTIPDRTSLDDTYHTCTSKQTALV